MNKDITTYHEKLAPPAREICELLFLNIEKFLPQAENKVWHAHPVWFLDGNPIVGYSAVKDSVRVLFWSGQSFAEIDLQPQGSFKAAEIRYTHVTQINRQALAVWLKKSQEIQWDYKNIVTRKGKLERLL